MKNHELAFNKPIKKKKMYIHQNTGTLPTFDDISFILRLTKVSVSISVDFRHFSSGVISTALLEGALLTVGRRIALFHH